ncbi:MAG: hypothetical protein JSW51_04030, partial [Gemmatimonadota bacterium]
RSTSLLGPKHAGIPMSDRATHKPVIRIATAIAVSLMVTASACPTTDGNDPVDPGDQTPRPTSLSIVSGDSQQDTVGRLLAEDLVVELQDQFGNTMSGREIGFTTTAADGSVGSASVNTGSDGRAATTFTLGTESGNQQVMAAVTGTATVSATFTQQAVNDFAVAVRVNGGDGQQTVGGLSVSVSPSVAVEDQYGNGVPGMEVTFAVTGGAGSITDAVDTTDFNGVAAVGSWTIDVGANSLEATVTATGLGGNPVAFTATGVTSAFSIDVRYSDSSLVPSDTIKAAFDNAAARWEALVVGELANVSFNLSTGTCSGVWFPDFNETVDDVLIWVSVDSIDGAFGIQGQAGPCRIRVSNSLPVMGGMVFDVADLSRLQSRGQLEAVILHEMGHVLGFGTIWPLLNLLQNPASDTTGAPIVDTYFSGSAAIAAFDSIGGTAYNLGQKVPVENDNTRFGTGSLNGHWRESVFGTELMTPQLNAATDELSIVTVASLEDMGYLVVLGSTDAFVWPAPPRAASSAGQVLMVDDMWLGPVYKVDSSGRITGVFRR